eukprot:XP_001703902.1 VSP [Giardia lamblia ATCC 50803]
MLYSDSDSAMWCGGDSDSMRLLFMGGCYNKDAHPGSEICTKAEGGLCTACNTANGLFKNPVTPSEKGSECILCSDTIDRNGVMGVAGCSECSHTGTSGPATCTVCQDGYIKKGDACEKCDQSCLTCDGSGPNHCTSCPEGKYLKTDKSCVNNNGCTGNTYADPESGKCLPCNTIDQACTQCEVDSTTKKPKCTNCGGQKMVKTAIDGTTTCVDANGCATSNVDGSHFLNDGSTKCILCSDDSESLEANKGTPGCKTCKKNGAKPTCSECLDGYYNSGNGGTVTCEACGANCATCTQAGNDKCTKCKPGFFMKQPGSTGECVACDSTTDGGREGCSLCSNNNGFKCTECKPNYRKQSNGDAGDDYTCVKTCEDDTACGGTSGACDAIVIDDKGVEHHYCSYCGEANTYPIDGKCNSAKANNQCDQGVCTQCTNNYFLYMGGCYSTQSPPGNYMCKTAGNNGICTEAANNKYFVVPGATNQNQSVLACGNPLGTLVDTKAYVGVDGCSACTAPAAPSDGGMTAAVCTSCDSSKKPNRDGSGCFACAIEGCSHCNRDDMCEACSSGKVSPGRKSCVDGCPSNSTDDNSVCVCNDGYSPDDAGASCVSSGSNRSGLRTGAIAGIAVAVVAVVGGLVGFLCWWFLCRGKA